LYSIPVSVDKCGRCKIFFVPRQEFVAVPCSSHWRTEAFLVLLFLFRAIPGKNCAKVCDGLFVVLLCRSGSAILKGHFCGGCYVSSSFSVCVCVCARVL